MNRRLGVYTLGGIWDLTEAQYNRGGWRSKCTPADADTFVAWGFPSSPRLQGGKRMKLAMVGYGTGELECFRLYRPPVPSRPGRASVIEGEDGSLHQLPDWRREVMEKPRGSKHEVEEGDLSKEERWLKAIWALSGRIHAVERGLASESGGVWQRVEEAFLDPYGRDHEPTMDVLVEHARVLYPVLADLAENPRKVLRRTHRRVSVGMVAEMDGRTLRWLSKQPGRNTAERAGARQALLAPVREENLDTLENRTLRALAERSVRLVGEHVAGSGARVVQDARKLNLLTAYRRRCRTLGRDLRLRGVRIVDANVSPNYVLQNGRVAIGRCGVRGRRCSSTTAHEIWCGVGRARSWEEYCLLFAIVACRFQTHLMDCLMEMPLQVRMEQREGRWIALHDPAAVFFPKLAGEEWTVEVRTPVENGTGASPGAAACLELKMWNGHTKGRMPIYALHSFRGGTEDEDLAGLERVCELMEHKEKEFGRVYGVALRSVMNGSDEARSRRDGRVMRAAFAPHSELTEPMQDIGDHIEEWIRVAMQ